MGSKTQSAQDKNRAREGQIDKLRSRDIALQQTIMDAQRTVQGNTREIRWKTRMKDEEQATQAPGVVEEQQQAFVQSSKIYGIEGYNFHRKKSQVRIGLRVRLDGSFQR